MTKNLPYLDLLRNRDISEWKAFQKITSVLYEKEQKDEPVDQELFAVKVLLEEQWKKWFIVATNSTKTNRKTQQIVEQLLKTFQKTFSEYGQVKTFTRNVFWKKNLVKVILQTFNLDFFIYGDTLRTNYDREGIVKTFFEATRRNLGLSILNNGLFYFAPSLLIMIDPKFILVPITSLIIQAYMSYRRTIKFFYINEINKRITQPNNK